MTQEITDTLIDQTLQININFSHNTNATEDLTHSTSLDVKIHPDND